MIANVTTHHKCPNDTQNINIMKYVASSLTSQKNSYCKNIRAYTTIIGTHTTTATQHK